jgi:hypothetical protein
MIITICILSIALVFFTFLTVYLFYGITHLQGQRDELIRQSRIDHENRDLSIRLILEKFEYRLPLTERALLEEIFSSRKLSSKL